MRPASCSALRTGLRSVSNYHNLASRSIHPTLLHNPRCSKSRKALELLTAHEGETGRPFEVREYLSKPLTHDELVAVALRLQRPPAQWMRTNDEAWSARFGSREARRIVRLGRRRDG